MELNVLALVKGTERFIYVYDDVSHSLVVDEFRNQAADPKFSFNWFDCQVLTQKSREQVLPGKIDSGAPRIVSR